MNNGPKLYQTNWRLPYCRPFFKTFFFLIFFLTTRRFDPSTSQLSHSHLTTQSIPPLHRIVDLILPKVECEDNKTSRIGTIIRQIMAHHKTLMHSKLVKSLKKCTNQQSGLPNFGNLKSHIRLILSKHNYTRYFKLMKSTFQFKYIIIFPFNCKS